jgi:hypothetical protein
MPDCVPFRLYVGDNIAEIVAVMIGEMQRRGVQASGTAEAGTFSIPLPIGGTIAGSYSIAGKSLAVSIAQRPDAVSCGTIESKLQDFILDAKAELKNRRRASGG